MSGAWRLVVGSPGGPEAIVREDFTPADPGPGEARVRHTVVGVNFIDTYHRSGLYPLPLPTGLGTEAAGVVEAVGEGVEAVRPGMHVAYIAQAPGTYATHRVVSAAELFPLPDDISDETAAASLLKGLTAWMLAEPCAKVAAGDAVLVHAAAGGVGSLLVQWLKAMGATVIGHAGSAAKAERVRALGADHALSTPFAELAREVRALTGGRGVATVFDGVGAASWAASLASLARRGLLASYGNASGMVPPFAPLDLGRAGSLFVTRPILYDYLVDPGLRAEGAARLFAMLRGGLEVEIGSRFPLAEAGAAHRLLEARETTGSLILLP